MRDSFLRRGNSLFCNGRLNWHVSGWSVSERKEGSGATVFAFSLGQVIFTKGNLHASLFCSGFKGTTLNRLSHSLPGEPG